MIDSANDSGQQPAHYEYTITAYDREFTRAVRNNAFGLMSQLDGWCSYEKGGVLVDLVLQLKPQTIVEIGVYGGKSLVPMAYALDINGTGQIYGIDPWETEESIKGIKNSSSEYFWGVWVDHEAVLQNLKNKIRQFNLDQRIILVRSSSEMAPIIENIDILHIDGNHSDEASFLDVSKWAPLVKAGGLIILDDMTWYEENNYTQARSIDWLNAHCAKLAEFKGDNVWGIWRKL
jgi:predicted O-methyltransferase YrrM